MFQKIEHDGSITIDEAIQNSIAEDEVAELDPATYRPTERWLVLSCDNQNGYYIREINNETEEQTHYYTLEDLRKTGIKYLTLRLEYDIDTSENSEQELRG